jgi:hypothetical protein
VHLHFSIFIGSLFMAFYWNFMGTKCQVYLRSFILINLPTTHCQTTLNTMVINFVLIIAPSSAPPPPNYVLTTCLVIYFILLYQPLPLWIVSFIAITPPLYTIVYLPITHVLLFHGPTTTPNNFHQYHNSQLAHISPSQQVSYLGTIHPNPILVTIPSPWTWDWVSHLDVPKTFHLGFLRPQIVFLHSFNVT